jgi:hypothetical protein
MAVGDHTWVALSGATNGRGIKVNATATAGDTIHTAHATYIDKVFLWAYNGHTADVVLTIERGGVTVPDDNIIVTVPTKAGVLLVCPGLPSTGSVVIKAFAATTDVIVISGEVHRIEQ